MIKIKSLTLRNFLSIGNVSQSINFSESELYLILGENLDMGGGDNRNGVGKSSIVNGLSYALYGKPLVSIKLENLVNKTNAKGMFVTIEFEKNGTTYRIERGRKPNVFKFYVNDQDVSKEDSESDEAQGENRLTQVEIEKVLGMSHTMFKHLIALNTYTEPFLSMKVSDQRDIIEQLLGITKLSEKADTLKNVLKQSKDEITKEEFRISAIKESNKKIQENIASLERRKTVWDSQHSKEIDSLRKKISEMMEIDIDREIENHNINLENTKIRNDRNLIERELKSINQHLASYDKQMNQLTNQLSITETKSCPACGQDLDDCKHEELMSSILSQIDEIEKHIDVEKTNKNDLTTALSLLPLAVDVETFYDDINKAYNHRSTMDNLNQTLERELRQINPYIENIESLKTESLQVIDYTKMDQLTKLRDHQEFLLKLLTNKDSFIRKKIIKQNLTYLNKRLDYFLGKMGLPHQVEFLPDLSVAISEHGRELDFDNLSRGERTRLILSLSWSFRDVFESLNEKFNLIYIDELIDNGLDPNGVESALSILKKMTRDDKRCVHLISHREELAGRVDNVIKVVKEGGFTSIDVDCDVA